MGSPSSGIPFFEESTITVPPLRSTGISRFFATMGVSDFRPEPSADLCIRLRRSLGLSPLGSPPALPGSSALLCVRAVPYHPGPPRVCICSLLPRGYQTSPIVDGWSRTMSLTRPNRFACATAHTFAFPGFDMAGVSPHAAGRLHAERAICVAGTFHPARGTRLILAHHDKQAA